MEMLSGMGISAGNMGTVPLIKNRICANILNILCDLPN